MLNLFERICGVGEAIASERSSSVEANSICCLCDATWH